MPPEHWLIVDFNVNTTPSNFDIDCGSISANLVATSKASLNEIISVEKFSELDKLFRVNAFVLRFMNNIRGRISKSDHILEDLTLELEDFKSRWLVCVQIKVKEDKNFHDLKSNLNLFEDKDKLLRCKGRIDNAPLPFDARFPVTLPREGHFMELILAQCHKDARHNGVV